MIGKTVSHYRIEEKLGEGGMGVVYRAQDIRLGRSVALKALTPEFARDPARRKRFQQEARAAASLTHPGIAAVYALEEVGEDLYIVYEYVRGQNLRGLVTRGDLKLEALLDIACDVAAALAAAHAQGVVHRDIKPENIIRTPEGDTKILDFGLARFQPGSLDSATHSAGLTDTGSIVGTVAYMSPEQLEGKEVDFRTDIFSFGVLLYELATGVRPFEGTSPASTIARILTTEPVPMIQRNPITPPELDRIVRKCLRKRPEERYQSTRDLLVDLETLRRDTRPAIRPAVAAEEAEPSLMRRALGVFGASPRRWWELQHLGSVFVFFPLYIYLAWRTQVQLPKPWGLLFFVPLLVFAAVSIALRSYLLVTGAFNPRGLPAEVRRLAQGLHGSTLGFMVILSLMAGVLLAKGREPGLWLWVLSLAVFGAVISLVMERTLARAAFPELSAAPAAAPVEARVPAEHRLMAAIQLVFLAPYVYLLVRIGGILEDLAVWAAEAPRSEVLGAASVVAGLLAGLVIAGGTTLALWRGDQESVRTFHRWFPLYVLTDLPGVLFVIALAMKYEHLGVALLILPVVVYLPLYQRKLAGKLLAAEPVPPRARELPRRWPLALAGVLASMVAVLLASNVGGWRDRLLGRASAPRIESLAVLPLENLSRDPEQDYFADGMTEALIADLAQISALRVISRTSVMQYKGVKKPLPEIARELNVDAVVEGSVQRSGDRVKITAQLIHGATDKHLWAGNYERELRDVLALQDEVARTIADQVKITLTPQEQARLASARAVNPAAHEAYLRGKFFFHKRNRDAGQVETALRWFEQAVERDPNFALAHAALAQAYTAKFFSYYPKQEWEEKAFVHIERALALEPDLAEAYVARGDLAWTLPNRFPHERAIQDFKRALALNPNLSDAHFSLGSVYMHIGLLEKALEEFQDAIALDPRNLDARYRVPRVYLYEQKYQAALREFERNPDFASLWQWQRVLALFYLGRKKEAFDLLGQLRREFPNNEDIASVYAVLLADRGDSHAAEEQIRIAVRAGEAKSHFHHAAYNIASAYALMGQNRQALAWLQKTAELGLPCYPLFEKDPNLKKLRGDPGFIAFMTRLQSQWGRYRATL